MPDTMAQLDATYRVHRYDLAADKEALVAQLAPTLTAIATRGDYALPGSLIRRFPAVRLIASSGAGYDGVDVATARALGIAVTNTPGAVSECVADMAWFLILATVRRLLVNDRYVRAGRWLQGPVPLTADKVHGERLGILGLGRIGKAVARRAEAFAMNIAYHGRRRQPDVAYRYFDDVVDLARHVKILVCAIPGRAENRGVVSRAVIDALGPRGYFINVSRGTTVDEPYLVDALVNGRLGGAGLDVFADEPRVPQELIEMDNVVLLPHVGSASVYTRRAMGQLVVDNLASWASGKGPLTPVPETPWARR